MAEDRIWTAAELEALPPEERQRLLSERVVTDLSTVPADFLAKGSPARPRSAPSRASS
jgi:hypothetical protein